MLEDLLFANTESSHVAYLDEPRHASLADQWPGGASVNGCYAETATALQNTI